MALAGPKLQKKMEATLKSSFNKEFGKEAGADKTSHKRIAAAISAIAVDIVEALQKDAQVAPGIPTTDGATTAAGKII